MTEPAVNKGDLPLPQGTLAEVTEDKVIEPPPAVSENSVPLKLKASLLQEYVTSGQLGWYTTLIQSLPNYIDDLTSQFGSDLYERMMKDAQVVSCINALRTAVLEGGLNVTTAELEEEAPEQQITLAKDVAKFVERVFNDLETPLDDVLWNMLDALMLGNKVAELVWIYAYEPGSTKPMLEIRAIHPKPRDSVAFVVDMFNSVLGFIAAVPGTSVPIRDGVMLLSAQAQDLILPRSKFAVFTFRPIDNDPRGSSIGFAAYYPWWLKQQLFPEWLKYLAQFATPSLVGYTAENANSEVVLVNGEPQFNADGSPQVITPEQKMVETLVKVRNGSAAGLPFGSKVDGLNVVGDGGEAFLNAFAQLDHWIAKGILNQTLATEEGEHQARAAAQVHQDVLGLLIRAIKNSLCRMVTRDIIRPLVEYNFGIEGVAVMPACTLGETEQQDFAADSAAIGQLFSSGYLYPTQLTETDRMLGLPPRPPEAIQDMITAKQAGQALIESAGEAAGDEESEEGDENGGPVGKGTPREPETKQTDKKPPFDSKSDRGSV